LGSASNTQDVESPVYELQADVHPAPGRIIEPRGSMKEKQKNQKGKTPQIV